VSLPTFLQSLFDHGHVRVPQPDRVETAEDVKSAAALLADFEPSWRLEFPGDAPVFFPPAALWAARMMYRAAQGAVFRDVPLETLKNGLSAACPACSDAASLHYSVDLVFRFLPEVATLARRASSDDPLLEIVLSFANRWPLSSVGMKGVQPESLDAIASHAGLLQLYVDRILARDDFSRLTDDRVRAAAQRAIGAYPELSPAVANELRQRSTDRQG
jgi:hypothetical protein